MYSRQIWKCHNKTPYIAIIKSFLKNEGQKGKTSLVQVLVPVEGERHKERVKKSQYGGNTMYSCMKLEQ
jgi:hypothetical protein